MAQRKQLTWTELRVGLFVLAALVILGVTTFYVTGVGFLGPKYRLYVHLAEVGELKTGAPVDLDGIEIGNVRSLSLNRHAKDRMDNVTVALQIDKRYQDEIRSDSTASLATSGLLGDRYVTITRGITGSVIPPNGEIPSTQPKAIQEVVERSADLIDNLNDLTAEVQQVVKQVQNGRGTLGKLMNDPALYNNLNDTIGRLNAVVTAVQRGEGTAGKLISSDELYQKVDATIGNVQDVTASLREQKGSLGKLIYDPSAYNEIQGVAEKSNALLGDVRAGKGTLGKLATDDTLYNNLRDASANVRDATAKLNSNQGTMGKFFSDPELYDNLTGLTGDMRLLINDFRQNPKKFLHVKVGVF
jgi:phospholipid/cholesterol/gamma-HCH transport system substrate-binding protein